MPVESGKTYYFFTHAYHHVVARVKEVTGKREADVEEVIRVHSDSRGWQSFFDSGIETLATQYAHLPNGGITWFNYFEWSHPIPRRARR